MCQPGDAVEQAQYPFPLAPEPLGNGECRIRGAAPCQRRLVGSGNHHNGPLHPRLSERHIEELAHLAPAFTDQTDHHNVGCNVTRKHPQQHRLADPGCREHTQPLAAAHRHENIDCTDARLQPVTHQPAAKCLRRGTAQRHRPITMGQRPFAVERSPETIDHAAKPSLARVKGRGIGEQHARAGRQALSATFRHDGDPSIGERDHFAGQTRTCTLHQHPVADAPTRGAARRARRP